MTARPKGFNPGGVMKIAHVRPAHARPAGPPKGVNPGGVNKPAGPRGVNPGGPMKKAKKAGHAKKAKRALASPGVVAAGWVLGGNDRLETCTGAAIANSLLRATGVRATDEEVLALGEGLDVEEALLLVAERGLAGVRLDSFESAALSEMRAGLIVGADLPGPHTVLAIGGDWVTWGRAWPAEAFPDAVAEEAWEVRWAA